MSARPGPGEVCERRFAARAAELRSIRAWVEDRVRVRGLGDEGPGDQRAGTAAEVVLAVDEACQNVIRHAYGADAEGEIVVSVERRERELCIAVRDFAPPVDPSRIRPRDLDDLRPGGLGTHLMRKCMDSVDYVQPPAGSGNLVKMVKRID